MVDSLLDPHLGMTIWALGIFVLLVVVLKAVAWGPLLSAIEAREKFLKEEREAAEAAKKAAEDLKATLDKQNAEVQQRSKEALEQAKKDAEKFRQELMEGAKKDSDTLLEKSRKQLQDERDKLVLDLRAQVADLAVTGAERLLRKSIDGATQKKVMEEFLDEIEKNPSKLS